MLRTKDITEVHIGSKYSHAALLLIALSLVSLVSMAADISNINNHVDNCSKSHGYSPELENNLGPHELGRNEREFLECVYKEIQEKLIANVMFPDDYKHLIKRHKEMTDQLVKGEITRAQRKSHIQYLISLIKDNEVTETERRIQDLSAKRDQFMKDRNRMLKRNPRMF